MDTERQDPEVCREVLLDMIDALNRAPRTRYLSLAITELEIAAHWLREASESPTAAPFLC